MKKTVKSGTLTYLIWSRIVLVGVSGKNLVVYIVYLYCIFADTFFHLLLKVFSITRHVTQVEQVDV